MSSTSVPFDESKKSLSIIVPATLGDDDEESEENIIGEFDTLIEETQQSIQDFLNKVKSEKANQPNPESEGGLISPIWSVLSPTERNFGSIRGSYQSHPQLKALHQKFVELNEFAQKSYQQSVMGVISVDDFEKNVIDKVAKIPNLVLTVLTLKERDEHVQRELLSLPLIRRIFLNINSICSETIRQPQQKQYQQTSIDSPNSVVFNDNEWFTQLLSSKATKESGNAPKDLHGDNKKLIDYLEIISNLTSRDYVSLSLTEDQLKYGVDTIPTRDEEKEFEEKQQILFDTVSEFSELLIPSLFELSNKEMERVGITLSVQYVLQKAVKRPFIIALVTMDCFFHLVLLMMWRNLILLYFNVNHKMTSFADTFQALNWVSQSVTLLGPTAIFYFICRLVGDFVALWQISYTIFLNNLTYRWTILEIVVLTLVAYSTVLYLEAFFGDDLESGNLTTIQQKFQVFTVGLLWIRGLGFLQTLRQKLATSILAVFEIFHDIFSFMIITGMVIFAFGDMLFTCYRDFIQDPDVCPNESTSVLEADLLGSPFCADTRWSSYLAVYRVFIGDFNYLDFNANFLTTCLFTILTFFGIVILLNMLIALVTEAYERSLLRSNRLFARSRIALIAKGIALQTAMFPREDIVQFQSGRFVGSGILRATVTLMVLLTSAFVATISSVPVYNSLEEKKGKGLAICITIIPALVIGYIAIVVLRLLWPEVMTRLNFRPYSESKMCAPFRFVFTNIIMRSTVSLLGANGSKPGISLGRKSNQVSSMEWKGRLEYTNKAIHDAVNSARNKTSGGILQIAERMEELEKSMERETIYREDLKIELQSMERRLLDALQQLQANARTAVQNDDDVKVKPSEK